MHILRYLLVASLVFVCVSCRYLRSDKYWKQETERVLSCKAQWNYTDLPTEMIVKVLYSLPRLGMNATSAVICTTPDGDTIGVLDHKFTEHISKNSLIKVTPGGWSEEAKERCRPMVVVFGYRKKNDMFCRIKHVFYGTFIPL